MESDRDDKLRIFIEAAKAVREFAAMVNSNYEWLEPREMIETFDMALASLMESQNAASEDDTKV